MNDIVSKIPLNKGYSDDKKYCIIKKDDKKYFLKVSSISKLENKKLEFEILKKVSNLGIRTNKPVELYFDENEIYQVYEWINGVDFIEKLKNFDLKKQFEFAKTAGKMLKSIHSIQDFNIDRDWKEYYFKKIERKVESYKKTGYKLKNEDFFINYIYQNLNLLKNRPIKLLHGDFHVGNFMLDENDNLVIIDFGRYDFGDPWRDFSRIIWSSKDYPYFSTVLINEYFDNNVPEQFWKNLLLYLSVNALASISWAILQDKEQTKIMENQAKYIIDSYDLDKSFIPNWYLFKDNNKS